jgi:hypothetical protein
MTENQKLDLSVLECEKLEAEGGRMIYDFSRSKSWDKGNLYLKRKGLHVPSLKETARLRMQEGINSRVSRRHILTTASILHLNERFFLIKRSPISDYPEQATAFNGGGSECYVSDERARELIKDSRELDAEKLLTNSISTSHFEENPIMQFAFEEEAKTYGEFLRDSQCKVEGLYIKLFPFVKPRPFVRLIKLCKIDNLTSFPSSFDEFVTLSSLDSELYGVR